MKTNKEKCVKIAVSGKIHHPTMKLPGYRVGSDGVARIVPATGGITYNARIGDCCMGMKGDHIEPSVSLKNSDIKEDAALNILACVGNEATIVSGDAKGKKGVVTGKHGGIDHVMIDFTPEILDQLCIDDKIQIKSFGQGLELLDYPEVVMMNIDPHLFEKLPIQEKENKIHVPVTAIIPAELMGSGLGSTDMHSGDYDIMTRDEATVKKLGLDKLRYGDFVFIENHANVHGPDFIRGAGTFGIIVHSDSYSSGHGPGVTVLMTSRKPILIPYLDKDANLINYM